MGEWSNFNANKASFRSKYKQVWIQTKCNLLDVYTSEIGVWVRIKSFGWAHCRRNACWVPSPDGDSNLSRIQLFTGLEHLNIEKSTDVNFLCMCRGSFSVFLIQHACRQNLSFGCLFLTQHWQLPFSSDNTVKTCENPYGKVRYPVVLPSCKWICCSSLPQCLWVATFSFTFTPLP